MSTRQFIIVGISSLTILVLLIFTLFDIKDVPDLQWREHYYLNSKQPYGAWMFQELIRQRYIQVPVVYNVQDTTLNSIKSDKVLYILIGDYVTFNEFDWQELTNFATQGNDVLLITGSLILPLEDGDEPFLWDMAGLYDSTVTMVYTWDSTRYTFSHYDGSLTEPSSKYFGTLSKDLWSDEKHLIYGMTNDSLIIYDQWNYGEGRILLHTIPMAFTNLAAKQTSYLDHFNHIFDQFDPELVVLDHMSFHLGSNSLSDSPLQFILGDKSLRIAYSLLIFAVFSFIIFKSKRRQRVIPTRESNVNTSLEYVKTLSRLFSQQKQHIKLVHHLETIFNHHLKRRYFLDRHDEKFIPKLVKKSKVSQEDVIALLAEFDRAHKKLNVGDDHLVLLYQRLDSFYKNCK